MLLPCARSENQIFLISTYGWRSDWIRNLRKSPQVKVTCNGRVISGDAEVIEDLDQKTRIVSEHPFVPLASFDAVNAFALTFLRSPLVAGLRRWVASRPMVVIHVKGDRA